MAKELRRIETAYEDGSYWVEYETKNEKISYELASDINQEVELHEYKVDVEELPIRDYVIELLELDDDCYYVQYDEEDEDYTEEFEEAKELAEETIDIYPYLEEYIKIYSKEIIFYGGLITKVLF